MALRIVMKPEVPLMLPLPLFWKIQRNFSVGSVFRSTKKDLTLTLRQLL